MRRILVSAFLFSLGASAYAQLPGYGANGIYPVYEESGQWLIFDKPSAKKPSLLAKGTRFLVIGSEGEGLFAVGRTSGTYGGACRQHKPYRLRAGLLKGRRNGVGRPLIAKSVPSDFLFRGSRARHIQLQSEVGEATYAGLSKPLQEAALADVKSGAFKLEGIEPGSVSPEQVLTKIDFGAKLAVKGLRDPFVFVEETQIGASTRRCLRVADGDKLVGDCAEMWRVLMAETDLLQFVAYDPGRGSPYVLAFTKTTPKWGDERWGFVIRDTGPRLFLFDAMDPVCRAGF